VARQPNKESFSAREETVRHRLYAATVKANELRPRLDGFGIGPLHFALPQHGLACLE
jgi:hypothetical protein